MSASIFPKAEPTFSNSLLKAALAYAERGFKVLPCNLDKSPAINGGFHNAFGDADQVRWWFSDVEYQLAIACELSGLVVVDVDDIPAFHAFLHSIGAELPKTYTVKTPSGGLHYYFRVKPGAAYPGTLCPGVDLKWRGYVMAPPSQAYSKRAGGIGKYSVSAIADIAPAPDWLSKSVSPPRSAPLALGAEQDPDYEEVEELLQFISPDVSYDKWVKVLMAIHGATQGSGQGMDLAIAWSTKGAEFKPGEIDRKWPGFDSHSGVTISTLAAMAKANGADVAAIGRRANLRRQERLIRGRKTWDFADLDLTNVTPMHFPLSLIGEPQGCEAVAMLAPHMGIAEAGYKSAPAGSPSSAADPVTRRAEQFQSVLLSADKAEPRLTQSYLIKGILQSSCGAMLYGPPGTGKTFYALWMAHCIASGQPFDGHKVKQGVVIYVSAEGTGSIGSRLAALGPGRSANLKVLPLAIDLYSNNVDLTAISMLARQITAETGEQVVLIVVDTLARSVGGGDENAAADMNLVLNRITALSAELDTTVLMVHHTGKDLERGARGSSVFNGGAETMLEMRKKDGVITVRATKQRDLDADWSHSFKLVTVELGEDEDGDPVTSCRVEFVSSEARSKRGGSAGGPIQKRVLASLSEYAATHGTEHQVEKDGEPVAVWKVSRKAFRDSIIEPRKDGMKNPLGTRNVGDAINSLVEGGTLGEADGAIWRNP